MQSEEINGLVFNKYPEGYYKVVDINYGVSIGALHKEEGPGWILDDLGTTFFDHSQLSTIARFIEEIYNNAK